MNGSLRLLFTGGQVSFEYVKFCGSAVDFDHAEFSGGSVSFTGAEFSGGAVDFSQFASWKHPPTFDAPTTPTGGMQLPPQPNASPPDQTPGGARDLMPGDIMPGDP